MEEAEIVASAVTINAVVRRDNEVATFFDAKWRPSGDLYYEVHLDTQKDFVRASFHSSGDQILRDRPNDLVLHTDYVPPKGVQFYIEGAPRLHEYRGAAQLMAVMPRAEQLHWHPEAQTTSAGRRDVVWEAEDLPPVPGWCFRFGIIEAGREDLAVSLQTAFPWMSVPMVVRDTTPWLYAGYSLPDDELIRYWNDGVASMGEPVGMFAHQPIQPNASANDHRTQVGWFAGSPGPLSAAGPAAPMLSAAVATTDEEVAAQMGVSVEEWHRQLEWARRRPKIVVIPGPRLLMGPFDIRTAKGWVVRCDECLELSSRRLMTRDKATDAASNHNQRAHGGTGAVDVLGGPKFSRDEDRRRSG